MPLSPTLSKKLSSIVKTIEIWGAFAKASLLGTLISLTLRDTVTAPSCCNREPPESTVHMSVPGSPAWEELGQSQQISGASQVAVVVTNPPANAGDFREAGVGSISGPNLCCDETKNRGTYTRMTFMVPLLGFNLSETTSARKRPSTAGAQLREAPTLAWFLTP